eukprot:scaffold6200_cov118-Cylindrotheca_fusiformis.AAC.3
MGNAPSTHNPELVDTSLDNWHGRKYETSSSRASSVSGSHRSSNSSHRRESGDDDDRDNRHSTSRYDEDVRDLQPFDTRSSASGSIKAKKSTRRPYDPRMTPLVEATAAVFHMNSMQEGREDAEDEDEDEISVTQRSAAVFDHLEEQASVGNAQPIVKLLETASIVSNILLGSGSESSSAGGGDEDDDEDDESCTSDTSEQLFKRLGSTEVIDTEKLKQNTVYELLDKVKSVDENQVAEFSSAVFEMLETAKSFSAQPVNERKLNIFRLLEENKLLGTTDETTNGDAPPPIEPKGSDAYFGTAKYGREDYPEVRASSAASPAKLLPKKYNENHNSFEDDDISIVDEITEVSSSKRSIPIQNMEGQPIDLTFVQDFDNAFNDFIGQNPKFLLKSPDLVHNIRIAKLQKLLAYMNAKERNLLTNVAKLKANKQGMEDSYQTLLREAARAKAARQIYFQAELEKINMISQTLEAKFKWAIVASAEIRTKKHQMLRQRYAEETPDQNHMDLIRRIPRDVAGENLLAIIRDDGIPSTMAANEKSEAVRKLQVNIAFLTGEVKIWQRKLEAMEAEKQKVSWIESILQQLTERQMKKLKTKFQKKTGIHFE